MSNIKNNNEIELSNCTITTTKHNSGSIVVEIEYTLKYLNEFYKSIGK